MRRKRNYVPWAVMTLVFAIIGGLLVGLVIVASRGLA